MNPSSEFVQHAISFVRRAGLRALRVNDDYYEKVEAGGASHVGTADIDNTALAFELFGTSADLLVIEEQLPPFAQWTSAKTVIFVDPVDGSAELGAGGSQFAASITMYGAGGIPVFAAVACPGMRPVYRERDGKFQGFGEAMGAVLYGGPAGVYLAPIFGERGEPKRLPEVSPTAPRAHRYTSVSLDLNLPGQCGLCRHMKGPETALARMSFSNIFAQAQVILGQANATTLGPSSAVPVGTRSGAGISGPKAWDLLLPLTAGVGLTLATLDGRQISAVTPDLCLDSFVLLERLVLAHPHVLGAYQRDIELLCHGP